MPKGIYTRAPRTRAPIMEKTLRAQLKQIGIKRANVKGMSGTQPTKRRGRG